MSLNSYPGNARLNVSPTDVINRSQILHYYFLSLPFHIYIGLLGNIRLPALLNPGCDQITSIVVESVVFLGT